MLARFISVNKPALCVCARDKVMRPCCVCVFILPRKAVTLVSMKVEFYTCGSEYNFDAKLDACRRVAHL